MCIKNSYRAAYSKLRYDRACAFEDYSCSTLFRTDVDPLILPDAAIANAYRSLVLADETDPLAVSDRYGREYRLRKSPRYRVIHINCRCSL